MKETAGTHEPSNVPIVGFMPTPYDRDGDIDASALTALAAVLGSAGIQPAVLGGMGEFYALNRDESRVCMESAIEGAQGTAVVAGIGFSTREAVLRAEDARAAGVAKLVANPHYYAAPRPEGLAEHIRAITEASGIPTVVYSSASQPITDEHLELLVGIDGFRGVKEEAFGPDVTRERAARWGDRIEWWGVGEPAGMPYVAAGATVVTSSMANASPAASVAYVNARLNGEPAGGEVEEFARAWDAYIAGAHEGTQGALKGMMHTLYGWEVGVRSPMCEPGKDTLDAARRLADRFADLIHSKAVDLTGDSVVFAPGPS